MENKSTSQPVRRLIALDADRPSTSSGSRSRSLNAGEVDSIVKGLNNSRNGKDRLKCLEKLRNCYKNKSEEEFAKMLLEGMSLNKTSCDICGFKFDKFYENAYHMFVYHEMDLKWLDNVPVDDSTIDLQTFLREYKLIITAQDHINMRNKLSKKNPKLLKLLDENLIRNCWYANDKKYKCNLCSKVSSTKGSELAEHFFTNHKKYWQVTDRVAADLSRKYETNSINTENDNLKQGQKRSAGDVHFIDRIPNKKMKKTNFGSKKVINYSEIEYEMNRFVFEAKVYTINPEKTELILQDESGKYFNCLVPPLLNLHSFGEIEKNKRYSFKHVVIYKLPKTESLIKDNEYSIILKENSEIEPLQRVPLSYIPKLQVDDSVEVTGIITLILDVHETRKGTICRPVKIKDDTGETATLVFWNADAENFNYEKDSIITVKYGNIYSHANSNRIAITKDTHVIINDYSNPYVARLRNFI